MTDGDWVTGPEVSVDPDRVRDFAAAVGHPRSTVPPTFAVTLTWDVQNQVMDAVLPPSGLGLHGEQAMQFRRALEPGEVVTPRARLEAVVPRRSGSTVTCRTEILGSGGPIVVQQFTVFQVDARLTAFESVERLLDQPPPPAEPPDETIRRTVDPDQALRYAAASGDTYRIHTDADFARAHGLADVILHGMCTLAIACDAVVVTAAEGHDERLRYVGARFTAPVDVGSVLDTGVWSRGRDGWFSTTSSDGRVVLERGRSQVVPSVSVPKARVG
jgi:acyl dehydratase